MRRTIIILATVLGLAVVAKADMTQWTPKEAANATRACTPQPGLPTTISVTTGASARNATALNKNQTYWMRCTSEVYMATGVATVEATTNHFRMPVSLFPLLTSPTVTHVAVRATTTAGTCYLWECK